jgi:probable HAF family extracellular repeat protein
MDPFLWQDGAMRDLGTLGGTFGMTNWMNSRGEVIGFSNLAGDNAAHPFLWNGHRLVDLGTLGGDNGVAYWVNDPGAVVGSADVPGSQTHHGFLWTRGTMRDLPPTGGDPCANAYAISDRGQAVGSDTDCNGNSPYSTQIDSRRTNSSSNGSTSRSARSPRCSLVTGTPLPNGSHASTLWISTPRSRKTPVIPVIEAIASRFAATASNSGPSLSVRR